MSNSASSSAALPIAYVALRILIIVNWVSGAAILTLLAFLPTRAWIMSSLDLSPSPEADRVILGLRMVAVIGIGLVPLYHMALKRLTSLGIEPWIEPSAGFFLWCRLPDGIDAAEVARSGVAENIVYAPGNVFSVSQAASDYMRFNAAMLDHPRLFDHLHRALHAGQSAASIT